MRHLLQVTRLFIEHSLAAQGAEFGSEGVVIHYADDDGTYAATCKQKKAHRSPGGLDAELEAKG